MMQELSWLSTPLSLYDYQFQNEKNVEQSFEEFVKDNIQNTKEAIPLISEASLPYIPDGHLVCLQGMLQDMFDSELYMASYTHKGVDGSITKSTRYRDIEYLKADATLDQNSIQLATRQSFYISPIPGEAAWFHAVKPPYTCLPQAIVGAKRTKPDYSETLMSKKPMLDSSMQADSDAVAPITEVKRRTPPSGVLLRIYNTKDADKLKLTDLVVVYGILEHARLGKENAPAEVTAEGIASERTKTGENAMPSFTPDAMKKCNLPRVHAIVVEKVTYSSLPWMQPEYPIDFLAAREHILTVFETVFLGDKIAAQFTLLHLLSSIGKVATAFPTTMPALNISRCPTKDSGFVDNIKSLLKSLLPQTTDILLSIENLNSGPLFMPVRDVAAGELEWGLLQLPKGSQVLVDETKLAAGQLTSRGLINCRALTQLATQRKLTYDFQFYQTDWDTDVRCLILSDSASIIKPNLHVPWRTSTDFSSTEVSTDLWALRNYLLQAPSREETYSIDTTVQEVIHNDFVEWRKNASTHIEVDDFAVMLCLLKLHALSFGETSPKVEHWKAVIAMETERRSRLKST